MGVFPAKLKRIAVLALLAALAAAVLIWGPPPCPFWALGFPCPGCGLTRALLMAAHGRFADAWAMNPLWPLWFFLAACIFAGFVLFALGLVENPEITGRWAMGKVPARLAWLLVAAAWGFNLYSKGFNAEGFLFQLK